MSGYDHARENLQDKLAIAEKRLAAASEFSFGERITIMRRKQRDGTSKWSVNDDSNGSVLNADGEWEYEPSPSNRSDEFIAATRFTFEEAWAKAEKLTNLD